MTTLETILSYITKAALFLVPVTALVVADTMFFPFITGKAIFFRILIVIATVAWAVLALRLKEFRPQYSLILLAVSLFTLVTLLAAIFGTNPEQSFFSNFERMEGWMLMAHLFLFFIVSSAVFRTKTWWHRFFYVSLAVSVVVAFLGLQEATGGGGRIAATLGNPIYTAVYFLFHIFLAGYFLARLVEKLKEVGKRVLSHWATYLFGAVIVLELVALYHTGTRGTILGLIGGALVTLALISWKERVHLKMRRVAIGALLVVVVLVGGFYAVRDASFVEESPVLSRFADISVTDATAGSRLRLWGMALEDAGERPILGRGQGNFNHVFNANYEPFFYNHEPWFDRAHNVFFDWLSAAGVLGFLLYLSLFASALYYIRKLRDESVTARAILAGLLVGYAIHGVFVFGDVMSYILFFAVLAYLHTRGGGTLPEKARGFFARSATQYILAGLVVVFALGSFFFVTLPDYKQAKTLVTALAVRFDTSKPAVYNDRVAEFKLDLYDRAIGYGPTGEQETRERLLFDAIAIQDIPASDEMKRAFFETAEQEVLEQIEKESNNTRLHDFLGALYAEWGMYEEAVAAYERALETSPEKLSLMASYTTSLIELGRYEEARAVAERMYEIEPNFEQGSILYAATHIYNGDVGQAKQIIEEGFGTTTIVSNVLIRAYSDTGNTEEAIAIAEARVAANPQNLQNYISLAAAYVQAGERQTAVAILEEVKGLAEGQQNVHAQIDQLIADIQAGKEFTF